MVDALADLLTDVRRIADPVERAKRFTELIDDLSEATHSASRGRQEALTEALANGKTQAEIAEALGLTRARVNQMLKSRLGPMADRALIAPDPGSLVTVAVVEKRDTETGQPVIAALTDAAVTKLRGLAEPLNLEVETERVPPPGLVDLNASNLIVLIGPRISSLIAQVIASDPVIQWRRDKRGRWYLIDTKTGNEFHSDFDDGWEPAHDGERTCIAQIGRIRRPDGQGSFLYLGGAHAPGTAGAVDYVVHEAGQIWSHAKRAHWSAVVLTKVGEDGKVLSSRLATPIYVHGKR